MHFIRVIISFKTQVIHTGTLCPSRDILERFMRDSPEIHGEITVRYVRDKKVTRVTTRDSRVLYAPGQFIERHMIRFE